MDDVPNNKDQRLLERLDALKPSTVQLERRKNVALNNSAPPFSVFDNPADLATVPGKLDDFTTNSLLAEDDIMAPESLVDGDAIEDLLASLDNNQRSNSGLPFSNNKEQDQALDKTDDILSGVYKFVQQSSLEQGAEWGTSSRASSNRKNYTAQFLRSEEEGSSSDEEKDDAEAAKYVENLLKEIQTIPLRESPTESQNWGSPAETTPRPNENHNNNANKNNDDEDNLSNRLAALSLPSVPSDQPGSRKSTKIENNHPVWCCICYDTPAVKCTDCEGDQLFCVRCWWEMHVADGGDLTESRHRAVKYEPS